MSEERISLRSLLRPGWGALKTNWPQFLLFQAMSLGLVIGYYHWDGVRGVCQWLSAMKLQWGLAFAAVSSVAAGVFLPEAAKVALGSKDRLSVKEFPSTIAFFAVIGMIIDLQYQGLAWVFGSDPGMATAVKKMLADQFFTTPLYGVPYWIVVYSWRANGWKVWPTVRVISPKWYVTQVLPLLLPAWFFWLPMTLMIYSLPEKLQFSLFALALAAWSLIMLFVARREAKRGEAV